MSNGEAVCIQNKNKPLMQKRLLVINMTTLHSLELTIHYYHAKSSQVFGLSQ